MDEARENPTNSIMWTSKLVGNGAGQVVTGDFAYWTTANSFLSRAYGEAEVESLVRKVDVENMMTRCSFQDISVPFGQIQHVAEYFHNSVHLWVGGDMSSPDYAPYDPVFYLHHCYIDYLWEKYREHQEDDCGIDPEQDYPNTNQANHGFNDNMLHLEDHTVGDGLSNYWTKYVYRYVNTPTCDDNCGGSDLLICYHAKDCCIPKGRFQGPTDIRALPLPGLPNRTPLDFSSLLRSNTRCDRYNDPDCLNAYIISRDKAGLPLQPAEELRIIEQMVAINRGRLFPSSPGKLRNLRTLKEDVERYEREKIAYKSAISRRREFPSRKIIA